MRFVEQSIRFIKQCCHLEDLRGLSHKRLKKLLAVVLAKVYFPGMTLPGNEACPLPWHAAKLRPLFAVYAEPI